MNVHGQSYQNADLCNLCGRFEADVLSDVERRTDD